MLFNSLDFIFLFLPIALAGFAILGRFGRRAAIGWLAVMSIVFYAQWKAEFVWFLLGSILFNFLTSRLLFSSRQKPRIQSCWLIMGIAANLGALVYFKYLFTLLTFFSERGWSHLQWERVLLPLGISFFTFTQIGYLIDLKQGEAEPQSFLSYVLFVTFFPHLIAGPILHHKEIMPQFADERRYGLNRADFSVGMSWFVMGLFKKVVIADYIAVYPNAFFSAPANSGAWTAWSSVLFYSMQLYFDFSGYSDMAVGLARMFSIRFPFNFNSPYKATSIIDFWARWHMTLTRYITLYLYTPLSLKVARSRLAAGKKISSKAAKTLPGFLEMIAYPTMVTMFLAGVWHGAGTSFMIFGLLHGVYISINHAWRNFVPSTSKLNKFLPSYVCVVLVFLCVLVAQIFFRADSTPTAITVLESMIGLHGGGPVWSVYTLALLMFLFAWVWLLPNTQEILQQLSSDEDPSWSMLSNLRWKPASVWAVSLGVAFFLVLINITRPSTFLYFQF